MLATFSTSETKILSVLKSAFGCLILNCGSKLKGRINIKKIAFADEELYFKVSLKAYLLIIPTTSVLLLETRK